MFGQSRTSAQDINIYLTLLKFGSDMSDQSGNCTGQHQISDCSVICEVGLFENFSKTSLDRVSRGVMGYRSGLMPLVAGSNQTQGKLLSFAADSSMYYILHNFQGGSSKFHMFYSSMEL